MTHLSSRICFAAGFMVLFFLNLAGCGNNDQAGVITETESGKTIAGLVRSTEGKAVANASVYLVDTNFLASRSSLKYVGFTDAAGRYSLDSVPEGVYTILIQDSTAELAASLRTEVSFDDYSDTLDAGITTLIPAGHIAIDIPSFDFSENDTLCLPGTLICKVVDAAAKVRQILVLNQVPAINYSSLAVLNAHRTSQDSLDFENMGIHWNVLPGKTFFASQSSFRSSLFRLTRTLPDTLQKLISSADSIPFPLWLSNNVKSPLLMDDSGRVLPLESITATDDSTLYWAMAPRINFKPSTTTTYIVFDSAQITMDIPASPLRYALHMDSSDETQQYTAGVWGNALNMISTSSPYVMTDFEAFVDSSAMSLAFWVKLSSSAFGEDSNVVLISAMEDSVGFVIRQNNHENNKSIGVELAVKTDAGIVKDTSIYGPRMLLDDMWHHYAVIIKDKHISILLDGKVIHDTDFKLGRGFRRSVSPTIGGDPMIKGQFDEIMFFTGTQDTTWMKLLYELQRPDQVEWNIDSLQ